MAKQRNSLGMCVLNANVGGSAISWDEYKKLYGVDLDAIFIYNSGDTLAYFNPSFSKILCVDFKGVAKRMGWGGMSKGNILVVTPSSITLSGDGHEVINISTGEFVLIIDTLNKTIHGGEA